MFLATTTVAQATTTVAPVFSKLKPLPKITDAQPTSNNDKKEEEEQQFQEIKKLDLAEFFSTQSVKDKDENFIRRPTGELLVEYIEKAGEMVLEALKNPEPDIQSHLVDEDNMQCRARMNKYNLEHCDWLMTSSELSLALRGFNIGKDDNDEVKNLEKLDVATRNSFCSDVFQKKVVMNLYKNDLQSDITSVWASYREEVIKLFNNLEKKKFDVQQKVAGNTKIVLSRDTVAQTNVTSTNVFASKSEPAFIASDLLTKTKAAMNASTSEPAFVVSDLISKTSKDAENSFGRIQSISGVHRSILQHARLSKQRRGVVHRRKLNSSLHKHREMKIKTVWRSKLKCGVCRNLRNVT